MSVLITQLEEKIHPGMYVPDEFKLLFQWIEEKGYYFDRPEYRIGYLAGDPDETPRSLNCFCAMGSSFASPEWGEENLKRLCMT